MKITIKEAEKICKDYNLGKLEKLERFIGGIINENYELETSKGDYVIKILSDKKDLRRWLERQLNLEFRVLKFLKENNFEYKITEPLKNKKEEILSNLGGKRYWIYKKIKGETKKKATKENFLEMVRGIAKYHKLISKFKHNEEIKKKNWILEKYKEMKKTKPKNETDRLMLENIDDLEKMLKIAINTRFKKKECLINHLDFHSGNVLFKKGKITGIIDFDNIEYSPKINDLANIIMSTCFEENNFDKNLLKKIISEYENINRLSRKEKKKIYYPILVFLCDKFWFKYSHYVNDPPKQKKELKRIIKQKEIILKEFGDKLKWQE